jgi:RNA polymerase sigma-70 factor (ECF subfamily)
MPLHSSEEITRLLRVWSDGDPDAFKKLAPLVYRELRRIAMRYMRQERTGHTLQTTALVNEAFVRMIDWQSVPWQNRAHFFAISAQLMRRILVDHARRHHRSKRGGRMRAVSLDEASVVSVDHAEELIAVDEALRRLASIDARSARVVELRFFGGMSVEETAEVLKVSHMTISRDWDFAKAYLLRELAGVGRS